jgi:hypothetical protein
MVRLNLKESLAQDNDAKREEWTYFQAIRLPFSLATIFLACQQYQEFRLS